MTGDPSGAGRDRGRARRGETCLDEVGALVQLRVLPGMTELRLSALLSRYGSAQAALAAPDHAFPGKAARARAEPAIMDRVKRCMAAIRRHDVEVLRFDRPGYPERILQLESPPPVLFARGRFELLDRPGIAVIGSRNYTAYGAECARDLARDLAERGFAVISGMARGIDAIAHRAALREGTIGVLGCGIDVVYPAQNRDLYEAMGEKGLLITQFPPGEPPARCNFPVRNQIIAAQAWGVLVVEAARKSGTRRTTELANDMGRDIFAVPGPIGRPNSAFPLQLIQQGCTMVLSAQDVVDELAWPGNTLTETARKARQEAERRAAERRRAAIAAAARAETRSDSQASGTERAVDERRAPPAGSPAETLLHVLDLEPRHADDLVASTGFAAPVVLSALLTLELDGWVHQLPGARFTRRLPAG